VAAWTAETSSATEAKRAAVAASLASWGEEGLRDAAVDSGGGGELVGVDRKEGVVGKEELECGEGLGERVGMLGMEKWDEVRRGQYVRMVARAGWMLDVKPVRMSTEDASLFLPVLGLVSGVGAERTVRKLLARARTERKNFIIAGE